MSRLIAITADELLAGTHANTMATYYDTDDEVPGIVTLGSANGWPNPDLTDLDERGRLRGSDLRAAVAPDSWNVLAKRLTSIVTGGGHVLLDNGVPMQKQNDSLLRWKRHTYQQDHPLVTDGSLTDLGKDPTDDDLAPVLLAPRVEVVNNGSGGFPAGSLWTSYFGLIGKRPMTTKRITNAAPAVQITGITQGQMILFYIPDEIPDSWSGIGFCAGPLSTSMKDQKRVDLRGIVKTEAIDHGPYRRDGLTVSPLAGALNRSYMGSLNQYQEPIVWRTHSSQNLRKGQYTLSYKLHFPEGFTASQQRAVVQVASDHHGEALAWAPPKNAVQQEGCDGWMPEFMGADGRWYTFEDAKGSGYLLRRAAKLHTKSTGKDAWKGKNGPVKIQREDRDKSGVVGPVDAMETPIAQGAQQMKPGKYAIRVQTASEREDMLSRPSPRTVVTLRDAGVFGGGAATGVSDQSLRVYRPAGQSIRNSRLMEVDPVTGDQALHWERFTNAGVAVTNADGFITVADTSLSTSTTAVDYRRTPMEPVDPTRYYTFRYRMNVTRYGSGTIRVRFRFLDAAQALIGSAVTIEDFRAVQDQTERWTMGPSGGTAHFDFPAGAAYVQVAIVGVGAVGDTRNFDFSVSNIGVWLGRITPRKVYDLVLSEDTPGRDTWPVPDTEDPTVVYPGGPYCRLVTSPVDPAKHRSYNVLENKNFEDLSVTSGGWTLNVANVSSGTFSSNANFALQGVGGGRSNVVSTSAANWSASIWKDYLSAGRNTFGAEAAFRLKNLPSAGTAELFAITRDAGLTNYLAAVRISSLGAVTLLYWNGTTVASMATGFTVQAGDDLRMDLTFTGLRTASGSVALKIKRNSRADQTFTQSSLAWTTGTPANVNRVIVGWHQGSSSGATAQNLLVDRIRLTDTSFAETTNLPGSMVEYWAPEGQPFQNHEHFKTGDRIPVSPNTTYTDSVYIAHDGITTPADGADLFKMVSYDADDNPIEDHGYIASGLLGRDYWDRYSLTYTTPAVAAGDEADAAYVKLERNRVGDGLIRAMAFQHQTGSSVTAFVNTNATSGTFNVVFKTTLSGGPKGGDVTINREIRRIHPVATQMLDVSDVEITTVTWRARAATSVAGLATATWVTSVANISPYAEYIEVEVTLTTSDATKSPEVRALFIDLTRDRPMLLREDGRDFPGGAFAYQLTPPSPRPVTVRKEYANGSVGLETIGTGSFARVAKTLKFSVAAYTESGKEQVERNPSTDEPNYLVEVPHLDERYDIQMVPEFTGEAEQEPDGTEYYSYVAEGLEADVLDVDDI